MAEKKSFPVIDVPATGRNIARLRKEKELSVREMQAYYGFESPQAIYQWQYGRNLPSVDNLYALSQLLDVSMNEIIVPVREKKEQQEKSCCSRLYIGSLNITFNDAAKCLPYTVFVNLFKEEFR